MQRSTIRLSTQTRSLLADTLTPVGLYLRLRDQYATPLLLESADYHSRENSYSFICLSPLARFQVRDGMIRREIWGQAVQLEAITAPDQVPESLQAFMDRFDADAAEAVGKYAGFYGHTNYDAVQHFEQISFNAEKPSAGIPDMHYCLYRFVIVIDHFHQQLTLIEQCLPDMEPEIGQLEARVRSRGIGRFSFQRRGDLQREGEDADFKALVEKGKAYCQAGEVFQIVFSRAFRQRFAGDEFNVYRALRAINPSPYLFFFDYGDYKLFGSSPEAQLRVEGGKARLNPIAGTFRRTGDDEQDAEAAALLARDPKENAEHVMLVDLARNDLGKHSRGIRVAKFREVQYFSHVLHLVSTVEGDMLPGTSGLRILADTFPAGTLSGAPKYRAMQLVDFHEKTARGFYGGAIGILGLDGSVNHAIMIRSFMSQGDQLHFRAGAGIVVGSDPENELQEVENKIAALRKALEMAETL